MSKISHDWYARLSKASKTRLWDALRDYDYGNQWDDIADRLGYAQNDRRKIKGIFDRLKDEDHTTRLNVANEEYIASPASLKWYLVNIYDGCKQTNAIALTKHIGAYNVSQVKCLLHGLSASHNEILTYSDTHGLDCLIIW